MALKEYLLRLKKIKGQYLFRLKGIKQEYIPDQDLLFRRVPPCHYDKKDGSLKSSLFRGKKRCSVDWEKFTTPKKSLKKYPDNLIASLQAKIPRERKQKIIHTPQCGNHAHSDIVGKKTKSIARYLANNCNILKNIS